jgi:hypothetical protein
VAEGVVDLFEMIQINEHDRKLSVLALRERDCLCEPVVEKHTVGQIG